MSEGIVSPTQARVAVRAENAQMAAAAWTAKLSIKAMAVASTLGNGSMLARKRGIAWAAA